MTRPDAVWNPPRCPSCGWQLSFTAEDRSWVARCWNDPKVCPVDVVPPSVDEVLLAFIRESGAVLSTGVAEHFGTSVPNANNRLTGLLRLGLVSRRRVDSVSGGKLFEWSVAR